MGNILEWNFFIIPDIRKRPRNDIITLLEVVSMVVIDIYGKIERTIISEKLKLYIDNLPDDWKESIKEEIFEEIRKIEFNRKKQMIKYGKSYTNVFDFTIARKIVETNIGNTKGYTLNTLESCIDYIIENMIFIEFDYEYR
mgnify:CR=1 FL=1